VTFAIALLVGFVPVVLFLVGLILMDSYKLVARKAVVLALGAGAVAALAALILNRLALATQHVDPLILRRYVAPLLEETLKGVYIVWLVRRNRVGFMVDAGIQGFAVGTGFALVENIYYAQALGDFRPVLWVVRGLGTAVMHGATTACLAILAKDLCDRRGSAALRLFLPGLAVAFAAHSAFNHLALQPLVTTVLLLLLMPLLLLVVFERSERATSAWLGSGMDGDIELLEVILGEEIVDSRVGQYLESLQARFPDSVVADMLCLLRVYLELSLSAKGILMARSAGMKIPIDDHVRANFEELRYLERSIGPTGKLAILPFLRTGSRELWQLHMLRQ
jgi:RsiW-degrading membrane proteinase PrsW (M82 family)